MILFVVINFELYIFSLFKTNNIVPLPIFFFYFIMLTMKIGMEGVPSSIIRYRRHLRFNAIKIKSYLLIKLEKVRPLLYTFLFKILYNI